MTQLSSIRANQKSSTGPHSPAQLCPLENRARKRTINLPRGAHRKPPEFPAPSQGLAPLFTPKVVAEGMGGGGGGDRVLHREAGLVPEPAPTTLPDKLQVLGLRLQGGRVRTQFLSPLGLPGISTPGPAFLSELLALGTAHNCS